MTYRGKKQEENEKELRGKYNHEIDRCASQNCIQDARNARISLRYSPGLKENDCEGDKVYDETTWGW